VVVEGDDRSCQTSRDEARHHFIAATASNVATVVEALVAVIVVVVVVGELR